MSTLHTRRRLLTPTRKSRLGGEPVSPPPRRGQSRGSPTPAEEVALPRRGEGTSSRRWGDAWGNDRSATHADSANTGRTNGSLVRLLSTRMTAEAEQRLVMWERARQARAERTRPHGPGNGGWDSRALAGEVAQEFRLARRRRS